MVQHVSAWAGVPDGPLSPPELTVHTFKVSGKALQVADYFWKQLRGPKPPDGFECDGCTFSPDRLVSISGRTYKLWPACVIHDHHYRTEALRHGSVVEAGGRVTGTARGRKYADDTFYWNLRKLVAAQGGGKFEQARLAWLYWGRVRVWGARHFQHWDEGAKPLSRWARLKEVWT